MAISVGLKSSTYPYARKLAPLAVLLSAGMGLSACSGLGGTTYGTGESQEMALLNDLQNMTSLESKNDKPIDYSSRPGIVLPPKGSALPAPQSGDIQARQIATNWPQDPDLLRKAYHEKMSNMTDKERESLLAAIRRLPPEQRNAIIKNDPRSTAFSSQIKDLDYSESTPNIYEVQEYDRKVKERLALIKAANGTGKKQGRQYLTQPPDKYRELTPELKQRLEQAEVEKKTEEKKGLASKLWPF